MQHSTLDQLSLGFAVGKTGSQRGSRLLVLLVRSRSCS
jgi:hypothetical protein